MGNFHYLDREHNARGPVSEAELVRLDAQAKAEGWQLLVATPGSASWTPFSADAAAAAVPPTVAPSAVPQRPASPAPQRPVAPVRPAAPAQAVAPAQAPSQSYAPAPAAAFTPQSAPYAAPPQPQAVHHHQPQQAFFAPHSPSANGGWMMYVSYVLAGVFAVTDFTFLVIGIFSILNPVKGQPQVPFWTAFSVNVLPLFLVGIFFAGFFLCAGRVLSLLSKIAASRQN